MPSPSITRMLQPFSHQNFYQVTHLFHYELILRESKAAIVVSITLRAIDFSILGRFLAQPDDNTKLQAKLSQLHNALDALVNDTRKSDYRCYLGEDLHPYDDTVWDTFFSELRTTVSAQIQIIYELVAKLEIPEFIPLSQTSQALKWSQMLNSLATELKMYLSEVETFLDAEIVETWISQRSIS